MDSPENVPDHFVSILRVFCTPNLIFGGARNLVPPPEMTPVLLHLRALVQFKGCMMFSCTSAEQLHHLSYGLVVFPSYLVAQSGEGPLRSVRIHVGPLTGIHA